MACDFGRLPRFAAFEMRGSLSSRPTSVALSARRTLSLSTHLGLRSHRQTKALSHDPPWVGLSPPDEGPSHDPPWVALSPPDEGPLTTHVGLRSHRLAVALSRDPRWVASSPCEPVAVGAAACVWPNASPSLEAGRQKHERVACRPRAPRRPVVSV
jgi:hypothetical protein